MSDLAANLAKIQKNIQDACRKAGRKPSDVRILLATKTVSPERLREVASLGYTHFGENRIQELLEKLAPLAELSPRWDFIGHLQSNKVKDAVDHCELIHSVDRLSLAREISKRAQLKGKTSRVLIEVNTSGELSKSGVAPDLLESLCRDVAALPSVRIEGLMTLAENTTESSAVRACFKSLLLLAQRVQELSLINVEMKELSMGMSQDYSIAVEEGATLLRLGSAVFGARGSIAN